MNLKQWRDSRSLTITDAAKILDISQPSLSRIEAGNQWPNLKTIEKIIRNSGGKITAREIADSVHGASRSSTQ